VEEGQKRPQGGQFSREAAAGEEPSIELAISVYHVEGGERIFAAHTGHLGRLTLVL
jgi:hypothetical protein